MIGHIFRKGLIIGTIILFFGASIASETATVEKSSKLELGNEILYVGGNETGNFSSIQDAIDNASNGDTVFVFDDSSPYYENIIVNKCISLIGENKNTTIIQGKDKDDVIKIESISVKIKNFGITKNKLEVNNITYMINVSEASNIEISNNIFMGNKYIVNILIEDSEEIKIFNNNFLGGRFGIVLANSSNCIISENNILDIFLEGISIFISNYNNIYNNIIRGGDFQSILISCGVDIFLGAGNIIANNDLSDFDIGCAIISSGGNQVIYNNITKNKNGVLIYSSFIDKINYNNFYENTIGMTARLSIVNAQHNWWKDIFGLGLIKFFKIRRFTSIVIIIPSSRNPIKDAGVISIVKHSNLANTVGIGKFKGSTKTNRKKSFNFNLDKLNFSLKNFMNDIKCYLDYRENIINKYLLFMS